MEVLLSFVNGSFSQETQQIPTEEVALDICLSNGQKVTVNILTSDQTEDVLDVSVLFKCKQTPDFHSVCSAKNVFVIVFKTQVSKVVTNLLSVVLPFYFSGFTLVFISYTNTVQSSLSCIHFTQQCKHADVGEPISKFCITTYVLIFRSIWLWTLVMQGVHFLC